MKVVWTGPIPVGGAALARDRLVEIITGVLGFSEVQADRLIRQLARQEWLDYLSTIMVDQEPAWPTSTANFPPDNV